MSTDKDPWWVPGARDGNAETQVMAPVPGGDPQTKPMRTVKDVPAFNLSQLQSRVRRLEEWSLSRTKADEKVQNNADRALLAVAVSLLCAVLCVAILISILLLGG